MLVINIVVLSGKGGTGKTLVATNLSILLNANYIDSDVEEPNGFIFLKPKIKEKTNVEVEIPFIDKDKCKLCFKCVNFCEFNALAKSKNKVLVFDELCHSCGGCKIVCPFNAINYKKKSIGVIEKGIINNINCSRGILNVGEAIAVPVIKKLLGDLDNSINIIDSSPGTSCNVINTLSFANIAILVTEPTEFGLHDLKRAISVVKKMKIPFGIVINKVIDNDNIIKKYCNQNDITILGTIKYDRKIAELYSKGELLIENNDCKNMFDSIVSNIKEHLLCK